MKKFFYVFFFTLFVAAVVEAAVIPDMKFRRLDTREGLSNSMVSCIFRDSQGYVWFGTGYGLNRYDGYRFRTYFSYEKDTTTLRNNRVDEIQEAHGGRLWLKQGMNYSLYDPVTEKVDRNPGRWLNAQGVKGGIESLHIDSKKNYWVKTYEDGFYYFNPVTKKVSHIPFGYGPNEFAKEFGVSAYSESEEGMVLVSTYGELMCIDGERGKVIWKEDYVKRTLDTYNDYWVMVDKDQNIWVITHSTGTYIYMKNEKRWYSSLMELMRAQGFQDVPEDIIVWEVCYDAKGFLWVASDHLGALVLDFKNKEWRQFTNVKGDETSLPDITLKHLYLDQLGRMWVASYKNGVAMCSEAMSNFTSLALGDINAITEDKDGNYWLGLNSGGIVKMDAKTREPLEKFTKQSLGVPSDVVVGSYAARDGSLWFGTWEGGLLKYKDGQWKNFRSSDAGSLLKTNNIWGVTEDRWGNIWAGVLGGGAVRIDKNTGSQKAITTDNSVLKTVWTNSISTAPNGWLVLGNSEYYALINPGNFKVINGTLPQDNDMKAITVSTATTQAFMDSRGLLWLVSPSGVVIYDRKTGQKTLLDMKSGLHGSNAVAVTEDTRHSMWVATDHGVSNITPLKQEDGSWAYTVRSFNDRDGLQPGPFNQRAIYCSRSGELLIGGQDGLDIINTLNLGDGNTKERPVFSGLVLFDHEVEVGEKIDGNVILEKALDMQGEISLSYHQNQFTIHMASDNGGVNNSTRFVYQLKGFNEKWIKTTTINPDITYMSLPSGSYTLCVRMLKDDGTMGDVESQLKITIGSPWYFSWWAWLCYLLIFLAVFFGWKPVVKWIKRPRTQRSQSPRVEQTKQTEESSEDDMEEAVLMDDEED
jgi:ligand-binding sensor domain-containing protein